MSKNLFLDRRTFLVDYHHNIDLDGEILKSIITAIFPVCSGINLEYFFGRIDPSKYGSGTKLPHNVTGNIGIMNGRMSDLRPGLAEQMTEIHDPIRLTFIFAVDKKFLDKVLTQLPWTKDLIDHHWFFIYYIEDQKLYSYNDPWLTPIMWEDAVIKKISDPLSYSSNISFVNAPLALIDKTILKN